MIYHEFALPVFPFHESVSMAPAGTRQTGIPDYVVALLYDQANDSLVLDQEQDQPYLTFIGGRVEEGDRSLYNAMLREIAEEIDGEALINLPRETPDLTIHHPGMENFPPQNMHFFLGLIGSISEEKPEIPAWIILETTEWMANQEVAAQMRAIVEHMLPNIKKPALIGARQDLVITTSHSPFLANFRVSREFTD